MDYMEENSFFHRKILFDLELLNFYVIYVDKHLFHLASTDVWFLTPSFRKILSGIRRVIIAPSTSKLLNSAVLLTY